jgi:hypothetical protein
MILKINIKGMIVTFGFAVFIGGLAAFWRSILDPTGTGGSILAIPLIFVMFAVCIALFLAGLVNLKRPFGLNLMIAAFLIPLSFFVIVALTD